MMKRLLNTLNVLLLSAAVMSCQTRGEQRAVSVKTSAEDYDPKIEDNYEHLASISQYKQWGVYNVHDPSCLKVGDWYYVYSTDAYYKDGLKKEGITPPEEEGFIQIRRSKDLINWEFVGWAFDEIPQEAVEHVHNANNGEGAGNVWAPYIFEHNGELRLYYSVSAFGKQTSYIGMATSKDPANGWKHKDVVVKTVNGDRMNAIDPTISVDQKTGQQYMIYGSYFGGLYCIALDERSGLPKQLGDQGKCVARRAAGKDNVIEAPEIIYNPEFDKYYLFVSYDPLMVTYNVRVGRSDNPDGPFLDFFGNDMADTTNNYPRLTGAYQFNNHSGWAGNAHCGVIREEDKFFMLHQSRLSPENLQMVMHVQEMLWTADGWPVLSPERYTGMPQDEVKEGEVVGNWEVIRFNRGISDRKLWQGQVLWGEGQLRDDEIHTSDVWKLTQDNTISDGGTWQYGKTKLTLTLGEETLTPLLARGWDWENKCPTILLTGLDSNGCAFWAKRIDSKISKR
ncbi:arabinan endo-1,5-alpha-L-arabinosidase [Limibacter armeniacum]|uniref:arabinan endo-1,5-alpha-L-arabinosidase n=1 Tax=Limibacter armeniacum TaxID=466084 RepID=UPI002FE568F1